jgi:hypothetical protein
MSWINEGNLKGFYIVVGAKCGISLNRIPNLQVKTVKVKAIPLQT